MQLKSYTHKNIKFQWGGGLNVYVNNDFIPLKLKLNNNSPSWRLSRNVWLSIRQLKTLISEAKCQSIIEAGTENINNY